MSDGRFNQVVAALKDRATVRSTETLFGPDAESAEYMAQMLENSGLLGPADEHGGREVCQSAVRYWLRAYDFKARLDGERVLHQSTSNDLRSTIDALAKVVGAHEDAQRELRLARGEILNLKQRRDAAYWSALAAFGLLVLTLTALLLVLLGVIA
ncbi:hypothetical protein [Glycomyces artemisiae]|uniref:Uncharacterized protein n=1 Tax=Glycomyces artemisiae TaxID=1076443 RepID=A0A2T0U6H2_9ACTN|nr:hypothetical protein [Glycomyces artemisiae]PRY53525.1 hypothetical protein B0I28_11724 [Glycomyces artemisiae]